MAYRDGPSTLAQTAGWIVVVAVVAGMLFGGVSGCSAYSRSQSTKNANTNAQNATIQANNAAKNAIIAANNKVQVTEIEIANQKQQLQVTEQQADIRFQQAVGVRRAQDEIAKTLTPMYIQWEQIQALQAIAQSGKNNTVIYVPAGQGGVPTITAQAGTGK